MRACRLVLVSGDGDNATLEGALNDARTDEGVLVVAAGEAAHLVRRFAGRCDFVHLLPGDFLFGHVAAIRRHLGHSTLSPAEQSEVTAAAIYGNLRYYYPIKSYFIREAIGQLRTPPGFLTQKKRRPLNAEWTVIAAARALGVAVE